MTIFRFKSSFDEGNGSNNFSNADTTEGDAVGSVEGTPPKALLPTLPPLLPLPPH
jgi:hypothetical protein